MVIILKNKYMLLIFSVFALFFMSIVINNCREYQDIWILQDIWVPTIIFIFSFAIIAIKITDNRFLAIICSLFIAILTAIPSLKYSFFYGMYDPAGHFGAVNTLLTLGSVPQTGFYALAYSEYPGMHILLSSVSLILGIDTNLTFKLVPSILYGLVPIMLYFATGCIDIRIQRGILIASSLPIPFLYYVYGHTFGLVFFFCFFCLLFRSFVSGYKKKYIILLLLFGFSLLFLHFVTITFLLLLLGILSMLLYVYYAKRKNDFTNYRHLFIIILILATSWIVLQLFQSQSLIDSVITTFQRVFFGSISQAVVPESFLKYTFSEQVNRLIVAHIKDVLLIFLSIVGLIILLRHMRLRSNPFIHKLYVPLLALLSSILMITLFQFILNFGVVEYNRFLEYGLIFSPFLVGLSFYYLERKITEKVCGLNKRTILYSLVLLSIISVSLISFFPCQPLIPQRTIKSEVISETQYITNLGTANTIYQQKIIFFTQKFYNGWDKITTDQAGRWQIRGFANESFYSNHIYYSQLGTDEPLDWEIFLLHYDGKSGALSEQIEYRTTNRIDYFRNNLNVIYDNGESFTLRKIGCVF